MGVTNLWALLEPCGRRIDVQALRGKRVAVDASGWIFRFIKAMRDEQGELIPNAHLIGFFRRICKLLYYNVRPIFIFDGSTPVLKRQTVAERRRRREQQEARVKKTAEKLLLNRLKQHVLAQAAQQAGGVTLQAPAADGGAGPSGSGAPPRPPPPQQAQLDAGAGPSTSGPAPSGAGPSTSAPGPSGAAQVETDADLALALALDGGDAVDGSESDSEPFEFMPELPEGGAVDPAVLATLPPSVQLDVMLRLRDRQQAANRGGFERRTGKPEAFSEFQIEQYLKSSTLRRTLDTLRGAGGAGAPGAPRPVAAEEAVEYVLEKLDELGDGEGAQREEERPAAEAAPAPAAPAAPGPGEGALHLSFEIAKEEIVSDDDVEWQDVDDDAAGKGGDGDGGADAGPDGEHWRERAARRQKYWSLSHGFQMGRKLAQWGEKAEGPEHSPAKLPGASRASPTQGGGIVDEDEDAQMQEAIRLSLAAGEGAAAAAAAAGGGDDDDDDLMWEDLPEGNEELAADAGGPQDAPMDPGVHQPQELAGILAVAAQAAATAAVAAQAPLPEAAPTEAAQPPTVAILEPTVVVPSQLTALEAPEAQPPALAAPASPAAAAALAAVPHPTIALQRPVTTPMEPLAPQAAPPQPSVPVPEPQAPPPPAAPSAPTPKPPKPPAPAREAAATTESKPVPKSVRFADQVAAPAAKPAAPLAAVPASAPPPAPPPIRMPDDWDIAAAEAFQEDYTEEELPPEEPLQAAAAPLAVPQLGAHPPAAAAAADPGAAGPTPQERQHYENALAAARPAAAQPPPPLEPLDAGALRREEVSLLAERRAAAGQSEAPTDVMFAECQELLQLFGLPYLIAPAEAEAQAAWLDAAGLVDGVVTDDNDALLFGARRLYRNIFTEKKYVEEYRAAEVERELGLSRERLVALALLLGSDYTPGVAGVGVVNAVEVVRAFGGGDGLARFAAWMGDVDEEIVALARAAGGGGGRESGEAGGQGEGKGEEAAEEAAFKRAHRNVKKVWELPAGFPSSEVTAAYLEPEVDPGKERFTFARPDLAALRRFCAARFGWAQDAADELLLPAVRAFDDRQTQQTLDTFVAYRERFAKIRSKRLRAAVAGITGRDDAELALPEGEEVAPSGSAKKPKKACAAKKKEEQAAAGGCDGDGNDEVVIVEETAAPGAGRGRERGRGRRAPPARRSKAAQQKLREEEGDGAEAPADPAQ